MDFKKRIKKDDLGPKWLRPVGSVRLLNKFVIIYIENFRNLIEIISRVKGLFGK